VCGGVEDVAHTLRVSRDYCLGAGLKINSAVN
jgi:hypothetical protein